MWINEDDRRAVWVDQPKKNEKEDIKKFAKLLSTKKNEKESIS